MTKEEKQAHAYIRALLKTQRYRPYAKLFDEFDFNYTDDPGVIAYMRPDKGVIVVNRALDEFQISTTIRHEILHQYLEHEKRLLHHLAVKKGMRADAFDDVPLNAVERAIVHMDLYSDDIFNRAADYEISNRGYTPEDKDHIRRIEMNGQILRGLVTDDDHPDWVDLSVEEMFDKLRDIQEQEILNTPIYGSLEDPTTFITMEGKEYGE